MKLEVRNLTKSFEDNQVLHGVSFEVESGSALGLLGRNGAGKTTTIRIIMDVFKADLGEVYLDGKPLILKSILQDIFLKNAGYILRKQFLNRQYILQDSEEYQRKRL